jgi:hypothetical protein
MAEPPKRWVYAPPKPPKVEVPAAVKEEVAARAGDLVETVLKPQHIKPAPEDERFNYIIDLSTKWYRNYFYFVATYRSPGPMALSPTFETRFARLEYLGPQRFALAFMRHTGQWVEMYPSVSLAEGLEAIKSDPFFIP